MATRPIALTCGDPSGVGPEIIAAWARGLAEANRRDFHLFGPADLLERSGLPGTPVGGANVPLGDGQPTSAGARAALAAMEGAAAMAASGEARAVVTAPVSKAALAVVGFPHIGQTEFFAERWGGVPTMGFEGKRLRVVLATWHIPLAAVPAALQDDPVILERAVERAGELVRRLEPDRIVPRIGVCGLNPHAGEGGLLGTEEQDFLNPRLAALRARWPGLSDCLPADTIFHRMAEEGAFDVIVALYHDQGLAPLKLLEFHTAVNVTLGLPFVRASPDHGTAFALAGKGLARPESFARAVEVAARLA